jgi:hypothetical protein
VHVRGGTLLRQERSVDRAKTVKVLGHRPKTTRKRARSERQVGSALGRLGRAGRRLHLGFR